MPSLVSITDLETEIGALPTEERARAEALLLEASDLAREIGSGAWTETGPTKAPVSVRLAVKRAARRAINEDPDGYSSETLGDWQGSRPRTSLEESGVFYTAAEEARIRKAAGYRVGAGSIRTPSAYGMGGVPDTLYAPVDGGSPLPLLDEEDFLP